MVKTFLIYHRVVCWSEPTSNVQFAYGLFTLVARPIICCSCVALCGFLASRCSAHWIWLAEARAGYTSIVQSSMILDPQSFKNYCTPYILQL